MWQRHISVWVAEFNMDGLWGTIPQHVLDFRAAYDILLGGALLWELYNDHLVNYESHIDAKIIVAGCTGML